MLNTPPPTAMTQTELAELISLLPALDLTWAAERQGQWWTWFERLASEALAHDHNAPR